MGLTIVLGIALVGAIVLVLNLRQGSQRRNPPAYNTQKRSIHPPTSSRPAQDRRSSELPSRPYPAGNPTQRPTQRQPSQRASSTGRTNGLQQAHQGQFTQSRTAKSYPPDVQAGNRQTPTPPSQQSPSMRQPRQTQRPQPIRTADTAKTEGRPLRTEFTQETPNPNHTQRINSAQQSIRGDASFKAQRSNQPEDKPSRTTDSIQQQADIKPSSKQKLPHPSKPISTVQKTRPTESKTFIERPQKASSGNTHPAEQQTFIGHPFEANSNGTYPPEEQTYIGHNRTDQVTRDRNRKRDEQDVDPVDIATVRSPFLKKDSTRDRKKSDPQTINSAEAQTYIGHRWNSDQEEETE